MIRANGGKAETAKPPICTTRSSDRDNTLDPLEQRLFGLFSAIGRTLSGEGFALWRRLLADVPLDSLDYAIGRWLAETDSGFPTPAALLRAATEHLHGGLPHYSEAFSRVMQAVRCIGYDCRPKEFEQYVGKLAMRAVRRCGGPRWFGDMTSDQRTTLAAQFRDAYKAVAAQEELDRLGLRPRPAENLPNAITLLPCVANCGLLPAPAQTFGIIPELAEAVANARGTRLEPLGMPTGQEFEHQKQRQLARFRERFRMQPASSLVGSGREAL
jgi:hypothetical protein